MSKIVDRFNVSGEDYHIEPVLDEVPTEGSQHAVKSRGIYADKSSIPVEGSTKNFTAGGAFNFFAGYTSAKDWIAKVFKNFGYVWKQVGGDYPAGVGAYSSPVWNGQLWVQGSASHGVYWSEDGKSWTQGTGIDSTYLVDWIMYGNNTWVACTDSHGAYYSSDGKSWTQVPDLPNLLTTRGFGFCKGRFYLYTQITSSNHVVYSSTDGVSWSPVNGITGVTMPYQLDSGVLLCTEHYVFIATDGGIFRSEDGVNFSPVASDSYSHIIKVNNLIFITGSSSPKVSLDDGATFISLSGTTALTKIVYKDGIYVGYATHWVGWSIDGINWSAGTGYDSSYNYRGLDAADNGILVLSTVNNSLYISSDGKKWVKSTYTAALSEGFVRSIKGVIFIEDGIRSADGYQWSKPTDSPLMRFCAYNDDIILACDSYKFMYSELK